jgi:hypothetical protein
MPTISTRPAAPLATAQPVTEALAASIQRASPAANRSETDEILAQQSREAGDYRTEFLKRKNRERLVIEHFGYIFEAVHGLTNDQRARLSEVLLEWLAVTQDTRASAAAQGIALNSGAYKKATDAAFTEVRAKLEAFCAECPAVRQFMPFEKLDVHLIDIKYSPALAFAGEPLTVQQRIELAKAWRDLPRSSIDNRDSGAAERRALSDFDAFVERAAPILSVEQLAVIRERRNIEKAILLRTLARIHR